MGELAALAAWKSRVGSFLSLDKWSSAHTVKFLIHVFMYIPKALISLGSQAQHSPPPQMHTHTGGHFVAQFKDQSDKFNNCTGPLSAVLSCGTFTWTALVVGFQK